MINARCLCAFSILSLILSLIQSLIEQSARALIWSSEINWQMGLLSQSRMFIASFAMLLIRVVRLLLRLKYNESNFFFFFFFFVLIRCVWYRRHTEFLEVVIRNCLARINCTEYLIEREVIKMLWPFCSILHDICDLKHHHHINFIIRIRIHVNSQREFRNVKNPISGFNKTTIYIYILAIGHSRKMRPNPKCQITNNNKTEANFNLIRRI